MYNNEKIVKNGKKIEWSIEKFHFCLPRSLMSWLSTKIFYPIFTATFKEPILFLRAIISWRDETFLIWTALAWTTEVFYCLTDSWIEKNFI